MPCKLNAEMFLLDLLLLIYMIFFYRVMQLFLRLPSSTVRDTRKKQVLWAAVGAEVTT